MDRKVLEKLKHLFAPVFKFGRWCLKPYIAYLSKHDLKALANFHYRSKHGKNIDWDNPKDLNEKTNWLKFYSDTSMWTELADKYKVRDYVEKKGLGDILVPLYGVWERAEDIDFNALPDEFVLKTNHGSATVMIVPDKSRLDISAARRQINEWLKLEFGRESAEPHYLKIKPLITAEMLLKPSDGRLVDYKIYMADGKVQCICIMSDRVIGGHYNVSVYDEDWNYVPERLGGKHIYDRVPPIPRPASFDRMKQAAEILSVDFPQVRVDFYDIDGKLYFGEMTFSSLGGYTDFLSQEELLRIGNNITLPKKQYID